MPRHVSGPQEQIVHRDDKLGFGRVTQSLLCLIWKIIASSIIQLRVPVTGGCSHDAQMSPRVLSLRLGPERRVAFCRGKTRKWDITTGNRLRRLVLTTSNIRWRPPTWQGGTSFFALADKYLPNLDHPLVLYVLRRSATTRRGHTHAKPLMAPATFIFSILIMYTPYYCTSAR